MALDPVAVALKFGFLAVLYLFLLWMARSALKDLRRGASDGGAGGRRRRRHRHARRLGRPRRRRATAARRSCAWRPRRVSRRVPPTISADGAVLGRGDQADIRLEDTFASSQHARLVPHGDVMVLEDLGSTNGTYLNGEPLRGPQPLHAGDRIRIGDSEFTFER